MAGGPCTFYHINEMGVVLGVCVFFLCGYGHYTPRVKILCMTPYHALKYLIHCQIISFASMH